MPEQNRRRRREREDYLRAGSRTDQFGRCWVNLDLAETRTFPGGVVLTRYVTRR